MEVKLVVIEGDSPVEEFPIVLPSIIGRGREADVTLRHPLISRKHCELIEQDGRLKVRDLESLNGTFVDHNNIDEAIVPSGSLLTVGGFTFRAEYQDTAASDVAEPAEDDGNDADTVAGDNDLAAAFQEMSSGDDDELGLELNLDADPDDDAPTQPLEADEDTQQADLNLGSLMDLAGASEADIVDEAAEDAPAEAEAVAPAEETPAPAVQDISEDLDLDAMFKEDDAAEAVDAPLDLEAVAEPPADDGVLDLEAVAEPSSDEGVLDLEAVADPSSDEGVLDLEAVTEASADEGVLDLEAVAEDPSADNAPPADQGKDDDLQSFFKNLDG